MAAELASIRPPDELLIERLEDLLANAKAGVVRSVGYAAILQDGTVQTCIVNNAFNPFAMLGALERAKMRYHNVACDGPAD